MLGLLTNTIILMIDERHLGDPKVSWRKKRRSDRFREGRRQRPEKRSQILEDPWSHELLVLTIWSKFKAHATLCQPKLLREGKSRAEGERGRGKRVDHPEEKSLKGKEKVKPVLRKKTLKGSKPPREQTLNGSKPPQRGKKEVVSPGFPAHPCHFAPDRPDLNGMIIFKRMMIDLYRPAMISLKAMMFWMMMSSSPSLFFFYLYASLFDLFLYFVWWPPPWEL